MRNQEGRKGITLIALVITIIVLLILAGVTLIFVSNQKDSMVAKSQDATKQYNKEEATEKINLKITNSQMNGYIKSQRMPTLQEIADDFCEDDEIQYVELQSQRIASIEKINVGTNKSIFTKLKEYPYEFEINSSLQLASIDGVKISNNDTVTISREEYEKLKNKVENIGQVYSKTNTTTLNATNTWVDQKNVSWTIPKGTWIVDFSVGLIYGQSGCFAFTLKGEDFAYWDGMWKSDGNYCTNHFSTIFTFEEEKEIYFSYYKSIEQTSSNVSLTLTAVKVAE